MCVPVPGVVFAQPDHPIPLLAHEALIPTHALHVLVLQPVTQIK